MSDEPTPKPQKASQQGLDLNSLSELSFGPSWAGGQSDQSNRYKDYEEKSSRGGRRSNSGRDRPGRRDRREGGRPQRRSEESGSTGTARGGRDSQDRGNYSRGESRRGQGRRRDTAPIFEPTVKVDLSPQDDAFEALVGRLTATARTYQLFEIAQLVLQKPERYVVVVTNKAGKESVAAPLYFAVPGHLPFETEEAAISHVMTNHLDQFFDIESVDLDPPKGNFQVIHRCGITGELLGPPNYHRYQDFLQRHYSNRIHNMSFDRFQSKIETVKEQEAIDAWMESMKKGERYVLKERAEGEPESFQSIEEVRRFLMQSRRDKVVGSAESVRFAGRDIERMPRGDLRRSVELYCQQQVRFPLDTANNLRGRLRRHNFAVYKKGSKGVSYVCSVKRKFRDESTVFSESIQGLITFIEAHPDMEAAKLPEAYLGIKVKQGNTQASESSAVETKTEEGESNPSVSEEVSEAPESTKDEPVEPAEAAEEKIPATEASADASPAAEVEAYTADEKARLDTLMIDLRWLVREGYVTEYGDGRLFAPAIMPKPKKKSPKNSDHQTEEKAAKEAPVEAPASAGEATVDVPASQAPEEEQVSQVEAESVAENISAESDKEETVSEPRDEIAAEITPANLDGGDVSDADPVDPDNDAPKEESAET